MADGIRQWLRWSPRTRTEEISRLRDSLVLTAIGLAMHGDKAERRIWHWPKYAWKRAGFWLRWHTGHYIEPEPRTEAERRETDRHLARVVIAQFGGLLANAGWHIGRDESE
jgi:hypothetical protein